jgi:hypothetical protein
MQETALARKLRMKRLQEKALARKLRMKRLQEKALARQGRTRAIQKTSRNHWNWKRTFPKLLKPCGFRRAFFFPALFSGVKLGKNRLNQFLALLSSLQIFLSWEIQLNIFI